MNVLVNERWLIAFLLGLARAGGFMIICPPFSNTGIPPRAKSIIAVALALAGASTQRTIELSGGLPVFVSGLVLQVFLGLALGFGVFVLFSAITMAGDYIDLSIGFGSAQSLDPTTGVFSSISVRLLNLTATALLFASGGHLLLVRGFVKAGATIEQLNMERLGESVLTLTTSMMFAAIEIALPVAGSLLIAEVGLAMLGKAAPQLNVFQLGFAVKILFGIFLLGTSIVLLPGQVGALLERALEFIGG
jgi:flagellar biosynthetic protein FliR